MDKQHKSTVSVSLTIKGAAEAIEFYKKAFGAKVAYRMDAPDGSLAHANLMFGNTLVYLSDEFPQWKAHTPPESSYSSILMCMEVEDANAAFDKAVVAGCEVIAPVSDYPWGSRAGIVRDPYGYRWTVAQTIEELTPVELDARMKSLMQESE